MATEQRAAGERGERGRPAQSVFAITQKGLDELTRWVAEGPPDWNVLKHLTCLRLFYGHLVEPARLIERVEAHRAWALQLRDELAEKPPRMPEDPRWEYAKLVVEWGLEYYAEEAASAERLAKKLKRLGVSAPGAVRGPSARAASRKGVSPPPRRTS